MLQNFNFFQTSVSRLFSSKKLIRSLTKPRKKQFQKLLQLNSFDSKNICKKKIENRFEIGVFPKKLHRFIPRQILSAILYWQANNRRIIYIIFRATKNYTEYLTNYHLFEGTNACEIFFLPIALSTNLLALRGICLYRSPLNFLLSVYIIADICLGNLIKVLFEFNN